LTLKEAKSFILIEKGRDYIHKIRGALFTIETETLNSIIYVVQLLDHTRREGRTVFIFGNGGSASTANHFANDLTKSANIKAIALTCNVPVLTAFANDVSYEMIFVEQLKRLMRYGDVVIGISGSGRSMNVYNAFLFADEVGGVKIALTGRDGGLLKNRADICIGCSSSSLPLNNNLAEGDVRIES